MDRSSAPSGSGAIRGVEGRSSASSNVRPTGQERPLMDFSTPGAVKTGYTALRTELERSLDMLSDSLFRPGGVANRRRTVQFAAPLGSPPAVPVHTRDQQVGSGGCTPERLAEERKKISQAAAQRRGMGNQAKELMDLQVRYADVNQDLTLLVEAREQQAEENHVYALNAAQERTQLDEDMDKIRKTYKKHMSGMKKRLEDADEDYDKKVEEAEVTRKDICRTNQKMCEDKAYLLRECAELEERRNQMETFLNHTQAVVDPTAGQVVPNVSVIRNVGAGGAIETPQYMNPQGGAVHSTPAPQRFDPYVNSNATANVGDGVYRPNSPQGNGDGAVDDLRRTLDYGDVAQEGWVRTNPLIPRDQQPLGDNQGIGQPPPWAVINTARPSDDVRISGIPVGDQPHPQGGYQLGIVRNLQQANLLPNPPQVPTDGSGQNGSGVPGPQGQVINQQYVRQDGSGQTAPQGAVGNQTQGDMTTRRRSTMSQGMMSYCEANPSIPALGVDCTGRVPDGTDVMEWSRRQAGRLSKNTAYNAARRQAGVIKDYTGKQPWKEWFAEFVEEMKCCGWSEDDALPCLVRALNAGPGKIAVEEWRIQFGENGTFQLLVQAASYLLGSIAA